MDSGSSARDSAPQVKKESESSARLVLRSVENNITPPRARRQVIKCGVLNTLLHVKLLMIMTSKYTAEFYVNFATRRK